MAGVGGEYLNIKWPNDLLDKSGRKVVGVLAIAKAKDAIIGVGINWLMNDTLRATIGRPAAALTEISDAPLSRAAVANTAATALWQGVKEFSRHGLVAFLDDAKKAHCVQAGEKILYSDGVIRRSAIFCGLGAGGELLLRDKTARSNTHAVKLMMWLAVDSGSSRVKWALVKDGRLLSVGDSAKNRLRGLTTVAEHAHCARVSCVAGQNGKRFCTPLCRRVKNCFFCVPAQRPPVS